MQHTSPASPVAYMKAHRQSTQLITMFTDDGHDRAASPYIPSNMRIRHRNENERTVVILDRLQY